jgi:hypothetical protein
MRIWDAVQTTDPAHTKKVEFGRRFTSIDAHWQIKRATEQFGPVGEGWGYIVQHSIERLSENVILAVADVEIWWGDRDDVGQRKAYGPIRATCELLAPDKSGKPRLDDDAPKKAMTDALTKGLSHLGFSADVFLGLFDDNKYVQKVTQQFKAANGDWMEQAREEIIAQNGGETRSTYQIKHADKSSGRLTAELWASQVLGIIETPGFDTLSFKDWKLQPCTNKGTKNNGQKLEELREKHPDLADKIDEAADKLRVAA